VTGSDQYVAGRATAATEPGVNGRARSGPGARCPSARRLAVAVPVGVAGGIASGFLSVGQTVPLIAWTVIGALWTAATWVGIARLDGVETRRLATAEEPGRTQAHLLLLVAAVSSLVAVLVGVVKAGSSSGATKYLLLGAGIATIVVSWFVVHMVFTLRYAGLWYQGRVEGRVGGVDFNQSDDPVYTDFAYLAFTVGMTFQVSDTDITTKAMRRMVLRHQLISYLFGAVIISATVNLAAGLAK
jgi:uncharacterized membrane protein